MSKIIWVSKTGRAGATGTETNPYASIQAAVNSAAAGTTIKVKAGVYTENVVIRSSGSDGAPIIVMSADGKGKAEVRPASSSADTIAIKAANYITLDGLKVVGPSLANTIHISSADKMTRIPSHVTVKNCDIRPAAGDGIKVSQGDWIDINNNLIVGSLQEQGIDAVGVTHTVISHNDVSGVQGGAAIQVKGGSSDVTISYNNVHDTMRWGIIVGGDTNIQDIRPGTGSYEAVNVKVIGNDVHGSGQQALRVVGANDVQINNNWFHEVSSSRFIDIVAAATTHTAWNTGKVTFEGNSFDRPSWLTVDSGQQQPTILTNKVDGSKPIIWTTGGIVVTAGEPAPAPVPAPTPVPAPDNTPSQPVPTSPAAHDDFAKTIVNKSVSIYVLANDDAVNWTHATFTSPSHGKISAGSGNAIVYKPNAGFLGTDTLKYTLSDDAGHQSTATVTVTVEKVATAVSHYDLML